MLYGETVVDAGDPLASNPVRSIPARHSGAPLLIYPLDPLLGNLQEGWDPGSRLGVTDQIADSVVARLICLQLVQRLLVAHQEVVRGLHYDRIRDVPAERLPQRPPRRPLSSALKIEYDLDNLLARYRFTHHRRSHVTATLRHHPDGRLQQVDLHHPDA